MFYDINKENIRSSLNDIGATKIYDEFKQKRVVFDFGEIEKDVYAWTRVRQEYDKIVISHKRSHGNDYMNEIETEVKDFDAAVSILELSGVKITSYQENLREKYNYKNSEIVIDTWPWLEPVIEIESKNEQELNEIVDLLKLDREKSIIGAIGKVYTIKYGKMIRDLPHESKMKIKLEEENQFLL